MRGRPWFALIALVFAPTQALRSQARNAMKCADEARAQTTRNNATTRKAKVESAATFKIDMLNCKHSKPCEKDANGRYQDRGRSIDARAIGDAAKVQTTKIDCETQITLQPMVPTLDTSGRPLTGGVTDTAARPITLTGGAEDRYNPYYGTELPAMAGSTRYNQVTLSVSSPKGHKIGQVQQGAVKVLIAPPVYSRAQGSYKTPTMYQITELWDLQGRPVRLAAPIDVPMSRRPN